MILKNSFLDHAGTVSRPVLRALSPLRAYALCVRFESVACSATLSPNTLQLNSVITTYYRTNITFTFGSNTYLMTISALSLGYFTISAADRGRTEQVDLTVSAPGVIPNPPALDPAQRLSRGQFQMTVAG